MISCSLSPPGQERSRASNIRERCLTRIYNGTSLWDRATTHNVARSGDESVSCDAITLAQEQLDKSPSLPIPCSIPAKTDMVDIISCTLPLPAINTSPWQLQVKGRINTYRLFSSRTWPRRTPALCHEGYRCAGLCADVPISNPNTARRPIGTQCHRSLP